MGDAKTVRVVVRMTPAERDIVRRKADKMGLTMSDLGRDLLVRSADPEDHRRRLDDIDARVAILNDRMALVERMEGRLLQLENIAHGGGQSW